MRRYLLADIGGTYTRIAAARPGGAPEGPVRYANADLSGPEQALAAERRQRSCGDERWALAVAAAGPVAEGEVSLTNLGWHLRADDLAERSGVERAVLVNDYQALARALPELPDGASTPLKDGRAAAGAAQAVLGPGTGLGVSGVIPGRREWGVIAGEGGHVTLAPADEEDEALIAELRRELGHVSAEGVLSGAGLERLDRALNGTRRSPAAITAAWSEGEAGAERTLYRFLGLLGGVAGDLALTLGARGGVYVAGGILPRLDAERLRRSPLPERFVAKGRFRSYLEPIPVRRLDDPEQAALHGLRAWLDDGAPEAAVSSPPGG